MGIIIAIFSMNKKISIAVLALVSESYAIQLKREPLLTWSATPKAAAFDMNYFVPHFGTDHDALNTADDIAWAEKSLGHHWTIKDDPAPPDRDYFVPHFGAD